MYKNPALRFPIFVFLLLAAVSAAAQIQAPDFLCTRSRMGAEELTWTNTPSNCGAFEATEIYRSVNADGPFTLLAEVADPTATTFADPNPAGELRFYYLRHRYACPGTDVMNSDTLDNLIPASPQLVFVGLDGGDIVIEWLASTSPEVSAYVVLEQLPSGNVVLDTVTTTRYVLTPAAGDPPATERNFLLVAIDPCTNDSPQGRTGRAMTLSATGGSGCEATFTFAVDQAAIMTYLPVSLLELFVSVDGGAFVSAGTFPPNATTVTFDGANDGENLAFYLEAVLAADRGRSRSEVFSQLVSFNQPVRNFPVFGAEVNTAGEVILQFDGGTVQPVALEASLRLIRANGQAEVVDLPGFNIGGGTLIIPPQAPPLAPGDQLRLRVTDDCGREVTTNAVAPVFLTATDLFPGQNRLSWTAFENGLPGSFSYTVLRAFVSDANDPAAVLATGNFVPIATGLTDEMLADDTQGEILIPCYQVSVRFEPDQGGGSAVFRSNLACVLPVTQVYVPNAFNPTSDRSENREFRPLFSAPPAAEGYALRIFDRWGGVLFLSEDPAQGWAGERSGELLSAGTYVYTLQYTDEDGQLRRKSGTINLLR